jgi:V8-like Glu-specific endopeptidase
MEVAMIGRRKPFGALATVLPALVLLYMFGSTPAMAQIRYLPASEYERINVRTSQALQGRLEALQRSDDFERLSRFNEDSRYRRAGAAVGRLKMRKRAPGGREGTGLCTAALISNEYAITNHHCLPGIDGWVTLEARLEMGYLDEKEESRVRVFPVAVRPVETSEELDYSILRVGGRPAERYGTLRLSSAAPVPRESLFIIHHPEGAPQMLTRKDCAARAVAAPDMVHSCDTLGGSSGSPIFSDETLDVVGLHFAGSEEGNYGKRMADLVARSPILQGLAVEPRPAPSAAPDAVTVKLTSEPAGAAIYLGEVLIGVTPHEFRVARQANLAFTLRKPGFADEAVLLAPRGDAVEHHARLRAAAGGGAAVAASPRERAADQVRRALAFWEELEKSGFTERQSAEPSTKSDAPSKQVERADRLLDRAWE